MNPLVQTEIDRSIKALAKAKFDPDPLLPLSVSHACSIAESAKKRHGKLIEFSLLTGLKSLSRYQVWSPKKFFIPDQVEHLASLQAGGAQITGAAFDYSGRGRKMQVDMLAYDPELRTLRSYEIKRGHGRHDSNAIKQMLRNLRCIQAVLASFGATNGLDVRFVEARILFWYGRRSVPRPWSLTGPEVDQHFGCAISAFIEEATANFAARVQALIAGDVDPYPTQQAFVLHGDVDA